MSKDPKHDQAEPQSRPQAIPVKSIRFRPGFALDMPGNPASTALDGLPEPSAKLHHRLYFIPGLRCFRVEWFKAGEKLDRRPEAVRHVPESWASWEPFS